MSVERHLLPEDSSLLDVLNRLNAGVSGVVCLVDQTGRMVGLFTDGDVRRAVLKGAELSEPCREHMTRDFVSGLAGMTREDRLALLTDRIRHVPILDEAGRPVEVLTWADIWRMPLVEPSLAGNELKYVTDCIRTNWISSQGKYVSRFESEFAAYHGMAHGVACSSGTTALHLGLLSLDISQGDEVIVPDLTFGATANAVIHAGANPVLVDVEPETWNMDPEAVRAAVTKRTKAILPVHLYGLPCDLAALGEIAEEHGLSMMEDCAEALGARFQGRPVGSFGDVSAFSFFANKTITTGEGGMVLTDSEELAGRMRILRDHGMRPDKRYWHDEVGYNYRMTNMQSALGCAQLERLDDFLKRREQLAEAYESGLAGIGWLERQGSTPERESAHWLYSVLVSPDSPVDRDDLIRALGEEGIDTRPLFFPLHEQPAFEPCARAPCPVSRNVAYRGLSLPTSNHMETEDAEKVVEALLRIAERHCWLEG
ncbi:MAG: aminotransferase class I/II-fold pyridoxal phosphate-dependent enzyme [Verrucomicrobiota bacterium]